MVFMKLSMVGQALMDRLRGSKTHVESTFAGLDAIGEVTRLEGVCLRRTEHIFGQREMIEELRDQVKDRDETIASLRAEAGRGAGSGREGDNADVWYTLYRYQAEEGTRDYWDRFEGTRAEAIARLDGIRQMHPDAFICPRESARAAET